MPTPSPCTCPPIPLTPRPREHMTEAKMVGGIYGPLSRLGPLFFSGEGLRDPLRAGGDLGGLGVLCTLACVATALSSPCSIITIITITIIIIVIGCISPSRRHGHLLHQPQSSSWS